MIEFITRNAFYFHMAIFSCQIFLLYKIIKEHSFWKDNIKEWKKTCDDAINLSELAKKERENYLNLQEEIKKIILDKNRNI